MSTQTTSIWDKISSIFEKSAHYRIARELQFMSDEQLKYAGLNRDELLKNLGIKPADTTAHNSMSVDTSGHGSMINPVSAKRAA